MAAVATLPFRYTLFRKAFPLDVVTRDNGFRPFPTNMTARKFT